MLWNFVVRDIRLKYRNSAFGYFWSLLEPLLLSAVYTVLFVILSGNKDRMYGLYVVLGVIAWSFFARSVMSGVASLTQNAGMIKQIYFPREIFAATSVASQLVLATLSLLVAIPFMIYFQVAPSVQLLFVPLGLVLIAMLSVGLGWFNSCLNVVNRDVEHFFRFITRAGMFLSPVMWTFEHLGRREQWADYLACNPMAVPITMIRNGFTGQPLPFKTWHICYSVSVCVGFFVIGAMMFRRLEAEAVKKI